MNKKLEYKDFDLKKVKVDRKKGVYVEFFDLNQKNDIVKVTSDSAANDDLYVAVDKLNGMFSKSLGLHYGWDFAREHVKSDSDLLKTAIDGYNEEISRCNVSGYTLVGSDDNLGVKISGSIICDLGTVGLASPLIRFEEEELGIGDLVKSIVEEIRTEVWSFLYKNKRGNNLFNSVKEDEEPTVKKMESGLNNMQKVV